MSTTLPFETASQSSSASPTGGADELAFDIVGMLLEEQSSLTAVEAFSEQHTDGTASEPDQAVYYRRLMPATPPSIDEQYAFEVDLDACSGCKACVVACHTLNGLEETESWRKVGTLTIGELDPAPTAEPLPIAVAPTREQPLQSSGIQHVTTACHHCEDPGCLNGCPVKAYDKDPITGIVRHLDDQCIGCKYCTMMCPYEVPKYSKRLGIVRKCDMCHQRLSAGEAPACVQSCPNEAIAIRTVATSQSFAISDRLVAGAPVSSITKPTTKYKSRRSGDIAVAIPQDATLDPVAESHWPLALMLIGTQVSVLMLVFERVTAASLWISGESLTENATRLTAITSLVIGMIGLNLAPLHLGQPLRAWRVFLGLRTSWLSREAIILGKFVGALTAATAILWAPVVKPYLPDAVASWIPEWFVVPEWAAGAALVVAIVTGMVGLYCSAMIYIATKRVLWRSGRTLPRFFGTGFVVGAAATAATIHAGDGPPLAVTALLFIASTSAAIKLLWEGTFHLNKTIQSPNLDGYDQRSHRLMTGQLDRLRKGRLASGWLGVAMSLIAMGCVATGMIQGCWIALFLAATALLVGESLERLLYFMSVVYDRMPGTLR